MKSIESTPSAEQDSGSEEEFFDAKDSWEDNKFVPPPPKEKPDHSFLTYSKSAVVPSKFAFASSFRPFQRLDKKPNANSFFNNKAGISQCPSGNTNDSFSIKNPLFPQNNSNSISKGEFCVSKPSSLTINELPVQSLKKSLFDPSNTQTKKRVPPIAIVRSKKSMKDKLEFDNMCLQQELRSGVQAIWVARFSTDGCYFAVGGEEMIVRVWEIDDYSRQCNVPSYTSC